MRSVRIYAALISAILAYDVFLTAQAQAEVWPWCAAYRNGSTNCGFASLAQCLAAVRGIGGSCNENQFTGAAKTKSARVRRERPKQTQNFNSDAPPVSIGLSIGISGRSRNSNHGGSNPPKQSLTNPSNTLPPGFN